jgi:hypothetical protein
VKLYSTTGEIFVAVWWSSVLVLSALVVGLPAMAQQSELPVCATSASDPDGDGFGWEVPALATSDPAAADFQSCVVAASSASKPVLVNRVTQAEVVLERAYWNANNDFANRTLRCEPYEYDVATAVYQKVDPQLADNRLWFLKDTLYQHDALSSNFPRMNTVYQLPVDALPDENAAVSLSVNDNRWQNGLDGILPLWTVNNGIYYGAMPLRRSPYVEVIDRNGGSANAVRVWNNGTSADSYHDCYDVDGSALMPTGSVNAASEGLLSPDDQLLVSLSASEGSDQETIDLETGSPVLFSNPLWRYNTQVAGRSFRCHRNEWEWRNPSVYEPVDLDDSIAGWTYVFHPSASDTQVLVSYKSHTSREAQWQTRSVNIQGQQLTGWSETPQYTSWQQTDAGFRLWSAGDNQSFNDCQPSRLTSLVVTGIDTGFTSVSETLVPVDVSGSESGGDETDGSGEGSGNETEGGGESSSGGGGTLHLLALCMVALIRRVLRDARC